MLPTSLSTFLLLMSARQDRLRRMLDTTWTRAEDGLGAPRAQAPKVPTPSPTPRQEGLGRD